MGLFSKKPVEPDYDATECEAQKKRMREIQAYIPFAPMSHGTLPQSLRISPAPVADICSLAHTLSSDPCLLSLIIRR